MGDRILRVLEASAASGGGPLDALRIFIGWGSWQILVSVGHHF